MTDDFEAILAKFRSRMMMLDEVLRRDGCIKAVSIRDPSYSILLTKNSDAASSAWRVTSFRDRQPVGHREYDMLTGGSPIQNALQEFAGDGWRIERRAPRAAPIPKAGPT